MVSFRSMKTSSPLFAFLVLALLSGCQTKQQLTAQPGYSANSKKDEKIVTNKPVNPPIPPAPKPTELRLHSLTFETNGSGDILYSIEHDKDGNLNLRLLRLKFTEENREFKVSTSPLSEKVKALFEGKLHYGGTLLKDGQEIDLSRDVKDAPVGDSSSKIILNTIDEAEYLIQAPVITTEGMETLFQDLRNFIEESLNPTTKNPEPESPASPSDACKNLKDLEGTIVTVTDKNGKVSISKGALRKIVNADQASAGSLKYEAEETREASGTKYEICVEYLYTPATCTLSKQPYGEKKTDLKVLSLKKEGDSTKLEASECDEESCSEASILITPASPAQ
jgi:hypothetical protein